MKSKAASKLADIAIWTGSDATAYLKIRTFLEDIEFAQGGHGATFMEAFNLVHKVFEVIVKDGVSTNS